MCSSGLFYWNQCKTKDINYEVIHIWGRGQYWGLHWGSCSCQAGTIPLAPCPQSFHFHYFSSRVLCLCPGWPVLQSSFIHASPWFETTGACHHPNSYWLRWDRTNFCPGRSWTSVLPVFTFRVARITGVSHHTGPAYIFLTETWEWEKPKSLVPERPMRYVYAF
jgi:hypothetical protein